MAHLLLVTDGLSSYVNTCLELGRRLAAAGHGVTVASGEERRELVVRQGLGFSKLPTDRLAAFRATDADLGLARRLRTRAARRRRAVDALGLTAFRDTLAGLAPDLVLIDGEMHEHILATVGDGWPTALLNTFCSIWRAPGLPPPHCLARPGIGWKGSRLGAGMLWGSLRWGKRRKALRQWWRHVGCDRLSLLRQVARDAGLDLDRETDPDQWLIPFTYRHLPVLSLHALELEFPHQPPDRVRYVGPMILGDRAEPALASSDRQALDALLAWRRAEDGARLIYAGFGSVFSSDVGLLRRLSAAVAERPRWRLVLSLSDRVSRDALAPLPEGVLALPWVPQREVLAHADAAVSHGGINTIDECVEHRVPMLLYCGFETDMAGNTSRVVHHGLGLAGDRRRDDPATIRAHLDRLFDDPGFAERLRRFQGLYAAYAENRVAEDAVERLLRTAGARREARP